jgi:NitT/TauT family transport system permease protein
MAQAVNIARPRIRDQWWAKLVRVVLFYIALVILWEIVSRLNIWPDYLFAGPLVTGSRLVSGFGDGTFITAIIVSLRRLIVGYAISLVLGMIFGLLIGRNRYIEETFGSFILGLQALPSVCWVPLAILWFGLNENAMTFVVVMGAIFSITLGVVAGVKNTPPIYLKAARNMGTRGLALSTQVIIPAALPAILTGLKQGWTFAWRSLMAAELIYITPSLGGLLDDGRSNTDLPLIFSVMLIIIVIGFAIDGLVFGPLEQMVRNRWGFSQ